MMPALTTLRGNGLVRQWKNYDKAITDYDKMIELELKVSTGRIPTAATPGTPRRD